MEYENENIIETPTEEVVEIPQGDIPKEDSEALVEQYGKNIFEQMMEMTNIITDKKYFDESKLGDIAQLVLDGYRIDKDSRSEWEDRTEKAEELANMIGGTKNFPWTNAANIKYPIIAQAAMLFAARALSNLVKGGQIVKAKVIGKDPEGEKRKRANRVGAHMSYQLLDRMDEWLKGMDRLLTVLPVVGTAFKKTFYSPSKGKNVSEYYSYKDVVVNYWAKSLDSANRVTHIYTLYPNEIIERQRNGTFIEWEFGEATSDENEDNDKTTDTGQSDPDKPHTFYEQHRWYDVDGDGYQEPYIVTLHKDTEKVVRIVARWDIESIVYGQDGKEYKDNSKRKIIRIEPVQYFTMFGFAPPLDGSFYYIGYGILLSNINKIINTTINQLLDAGTINNLSGGFVSKKATLKTGREGGTLEFKIGEWKPVTHHGDDLSKSFYKIPTNQPSAVLFNMLTMMIDAAKEFSSSMDLMAGKPPPAGVPATTTLTMLEQGMVTYTAVFGRIHDSLKQEFKKLYRLNRLYLPEIDYYIVLDSDEAISVDDYNAKDCDIVPISNAEIITNSQIRLQAQAELELVTGGQITDPKRKDIIVKSYLKAIGSDNFDELYPDGVGEEPPSPQEQAMAKEMELKEREVLAKEQELEIKADTAEAEKAKLAAEARKADAEANKANAEAENVSVQAELEATKRELARSKDLNKDLEGTVKKAIGKKKEEKKGFFGRKKSE